jgi:murein hydrolase activator
VRRGVIAAALLAGPLAVAAIAGGTGPEAGVPAVVRAVDPAAGIAAARARLAAAQALWGMADAAEGEAPVIALASAIRAAEAAIEGLRDGIAGSDSEARAILRGFAEDREATRRLLAAGIAAARAPDGRAGAPRAHPGGPVAAARAAMMLGPAEAGLRAEAAALGARFAALAAVRRLGAVGTAELAEAAAAVAAAREDLRAAIVAEGPAGPPAPDSAAAALAAGSETLTDLASRVAGQAVAGQAGGDVAAAAAALEATVRKSARNLPDGDEGAAALRLLAPVGGRVLRGFAEADAGGERRPGLTFLAPARALVTAPAAGIVRYVGPFLDFGAVVVIEIEPGTVALLAGMSVPAVAEGVVVEAGAPVGFLGGRAADPQEYLMMPGHGSDAMPAETLYMEIWQQREPVDPAPWLAAGQG